MTGDSSCTEWIGVRLPQVEEGVVAAGSVGFWGRKSGLDYCLLSFILAKLLIL